MKTLKLSKYDLIHKEFFIEALYACVQKSIDACVECGASYDEDYLESKWEKRLIDMIEGAKYNNFNDVMLEVEERFSF